MMDHGKRIRRAQEALVEGHYDAFLITHLPNIRYLCGFTGSAGVFALGAGRAVLFSDGRYTQQASEEVRGAKIEINKNPLSTAAEWLERQRSVRRIGIEAAHITVAERDSLRKRLSRGKKIVTAPPVIERIRIVKDAEEISRIRAACKLGGRLFDRLLNVVRASMKESEVAGELEFEARRAGAEQMAFPTIIAAGARSALPHGRASGSRIPSRGFVVCDFGVILAGYCSDMTRTLYVGKPTEESRDGYEAVREAQLAALEAVRPGVTVGEVDRAVRKSLRRRRLDNFFTHSTGHGVGLEIHEAPRVAADQNEVLRPGMVITVEPGIYIPRKWGIRIEDTVVVSEKGCEILTSCPKNLIAL